MRTHQERPRAGAIAGENTSQVSSVINMHLHACRLHPARHGFIAPAHGWRQESAKGAVVSIADLRQLAASVN
jgi:hypothetical protein